MTRASVYEAPTLGLALHEGMAELLRHSTINSAVEVALKRWKEDTQHGFLDVDQESWATSIEEGAALVEALLRAWNRVRKDTFLKEYKPLFTEEEFELVLSPLIGFDGRPDLIVEDVLGQVWIIDWKSTSRAYDWGSKYHRESQSLTQPYIASRLLNRPVMGTLYEGLWKGNSSGSILIRGVRSQSLPRTYSGYAADAKAKDQERFDVWTEKFDGMQPGQTPIEYWVNWLPEDVVRDQFLTPQAVPYDDELAKRWMEDTARNETAVAQALADYHDGKLPFNELMSFFYPSPSDWNCMGCPYESICWDGKPIEKLCESGDLVARRDHHKKVA